MKNAYLVLAGLISLSILSSCTSSAYVSERPREVVYVRPAPPAPRYVWVSGDWVWMHGRYQWHEGYWAAPRHGSYWVNGHWQNSRSGYRWSPGYWK